MADDVTEPYSCWDAWFDGLADGLRSKPVAVDRGRLDVGIEPDMRHGDEPLIAMPFQDSGGWYVG